MAKEALYRLVKTLTGPEKRYYRLHTSRQLRQREGKLYSLFSHLQKLSTYDETKVKEAMSNVIPSKDFAVYKTLLYQDLLRALQAFHYERTPAMQLRSGLDKVELLHLRGATKDALRLLNRLQSRATALGHTLQLTELLAWERRLLRSLAPEQLRLELDQLDAVLDQHRRELDEELKALRLFDRLFALLQVERRMEKRALRETVADLSQQLQSLRPHDGWTFNTWSAWLNAWTLIHQMKGEFQKMFESCTELLELWEENVALQKAEPIRHLRVQTQWLNSALASGNIGSHLEKVRALRKGPPATNQEQARLVFQSLNLELLWLIQQENLNTALKFIESFQSAMKPLLPLLTEVHLRAFQINSAEVLFRSGQYAKVLKLLNPVFKGSNQGRDSTTFRFALLLGIVCHLEVGNHTLAESQLALLTRRLRNEDADWEFGHLAAKWLRKLHKDWGTSETKRIKAAFAVALGDLSHDKSTITRLRDLLALWCEG